MAGPAKIHGKGRPSLVLGLLLAAVAFTAVARADDVSNSLDGSIDAVAEVMPLVQGGANGSTTLYVQPRNGDGKNGCNLTGSASLVLSVSSSDGSVATVSPSSITFTSCGDTPALTIVPQGLGSATISVVQSSNNSGGTFNLAPATFRVDVAAPPNTPPQVAVVGVTGGASYAKGSVPAAMCAVSDAEDGDSSFAATLGAVSGPYAADGIGAQEASCSYTDAGGLTAAASLSYGIVDTSAPSIGYALAGILGDNGWYTSDVGLAWTVVEDESPSSLATIGCADQSITSDQGETTYACSATSAGGSGGPVEVSIKRDGSAPSVTGAPMSGPNADGWYGGDVTIAWSCADVGPSGLADGCPATTSIAGEGRSLTDTLGPIRDLAGNSTVGVSSPGVSIDRGAPNVVASTTATPIEVGGIDWFKDSVTFDWAATDPGLADGSAGSGVKSGPTPSSSTFSATGADHGASAEAADYAGNVGTGTLSGVHVDASKPLVDITCPAQVLLGGSGSAAWSASDTGSGLASPSAGSIALDTSSVGSKTATAPTASDNVGHESDPASCAYRVVYGFSGLFAPIDRPNAMNLSKAGQAIPLKWRLTNADGDPVTNLASATVTVSAISCSLGSTVDLVEEVAAGSSGLQNLGDGYYQINWKSPTAYAGSCKGLNLNLGEGASRANLAYISFKK